MAESAKCLVFLTTSVFVYPAKGRLGSRTTKLDSGAFDTIPHQRLRATPPDQRAIGPCQSRTLGQRAGKRAKSERRP